MRKCTKVVRKPESEKIPASTVKVGDRIHHDGAYRFVSNILDCGGTLIRFRFAPAWGNKWAGNDELVHRWLW